METGVCGAPGQLVVLLAEGELKITPGFATIRHHLMKEKLALD